MTRRIVSAAFLTALAVMLGGGCETNRHAVRQTITPLMAYIEQYKFTPFVVPRDGDGDGTVIAFNKGQETIVAAASQCLSKEMVPREDINVFLADVEYDITRTAKVELLAARVLESGVNVAGAFNDSRVKKVQVRFIDPFSRRITQLATESYVRQLPKENDCRRALTKDGNLIIHTVLGAKGVEYSFIGENNSGVSLDAQLLDQINLKPELRSQYEGKASLNVNKLVFVGYRTWEAQPESGFATNNIVVSDVDPKTVEKARSNSEGR